MKTWNDPTASADLRITDAANRFGWYLSRWVRAGGIIRLVATRPEDPYTRLEVQLSRNLVMQSVRTGTGQAFQEGQVTLLAQAISYLITEGKEV